MNIDFNLVISLQIASSIISLVLAVISWNKRGNAGKAAIYLSLCLVAVSIYNFGYAMELTCKTLEQVMRWVRFEHWGIQFITPLWLLFTLCISGREKMITPLRTALLLVIPLISLAAAQTLGGLNLAHINPHLDQFGSLMTFHYERGLIINLSIVYISLCLILILILFSIMLVRSPAAFRMQAIIFWVGSLLPFIGQFIYNFGFSRYHLDIAPLSLTISSLFLTLGFLQYRLLDIVPLARDLIFDNLSDGIMVLDKQNQIIDINPRLQVMLSGINSKSIGKSAVDVLKDHAALANFISNKSSGLIEFENVESNKVVSFMGTLTPIYDKQKRKVGKIITLHDNTQTRHLLDQLEILATKDSLTGAYNRRSFNQIAEQILDGQQKTGGVLSMIMLDLDHFKNVNDSYSHPAGDLALKMVVDTCRKSLRQGDILGRYGGEEFTILLPEIPPDEAFAIAERIRLGIENCVITFENHSFSITASIGITSVFAPFEQNIEDFYRTADKAVYKAKELGRNRVCALDFEKQSENI